MAASAGLLIFFIKCLQRLEILIGNINFVLCDYLTINHHRESMTAKLCLQMYKLLNYYFELYVEAINAKHGE